MKAKSIAQTWAQQTLERRRVAAEVHAEKIAAADTANAADSKKITALADEIATLDARLDPENLDAIQLLAAKREQLERLKIKFAGDAQKRLAAAADVSSDPRLPAVSEDFSFLQFIAESESELRAGFRRCFQNEAVADRSFNDSNSGAWFQRYHRLGISADEMDSIVWRLAYGENLPWKF